MSLANEAAYLYVYAKQAQKLQHEIQALKEDTETFTKKFHHAKTSGEKEKFRKKYHSVAEKAKKRLEQYHHTLATLRRHQVAFAHALQKEYSEN